MSEEIKTKPFQHYNRWVKDFTKKPKELHPSVLGKLQFFEHEHLPKPLARIVYPIATLAYSLAHNLPNNPELTLALDKLREAKDRFVTAYLYKDPETQTQGEEHDE